MSARAVPPDEEVARGVETLVRARLPGARALMVSSVKALSGGNARRAWALDIEWDDASGHHAHGCVLLARLEAGQLEADMSREYDTLAALHPAGLPVPRVLWLDEDGALLGMPGFLAVRGAGRAGVVDLLKPGSAITRRLTEELVRVAAKLHALDWRALEPSLAERGMGERNAADAPRRELAKWEAQFRKQRMEPLPALASVFAWLDRNMPARQRIAVVHGDFRLGNFLHEEGRITLLLDWEMSHIGDALEDIAWMYRRLWSPEHFLPLEAAVKIYEEAGGGAVDPAHLAWHRIFAEAKYAVISLTAARSFADGAAGNLRLAARASTVNECLRLALGWIGEQEAAC